MTEATITEKKAKNPPVREGSIWRYLGKTLNGYKVSGSLIFEVRFNDDGPVGSCQLWHMRRRFNKKLPTSWTPFVTNYNIDNFNRITRWEHLQG